MTTRSTTDRPDIAASPRQAAALVADLLGWFATARRDLPWRRDRDGYRVWISESMLQQTRVEAAVPYFERFLARFPTVADLAAAPIEAVLATWSGLGYYRRARSLHAAARAVVERHGGVLPSEPEALLALPGIGPYTAGAVASIAFDRPEPLVDGNVARVLSRLFVLDQPSDSARFRAETWRLAGELVRIAAPRGPGAWNQALMELGAVVCVPRDPRCLACPVKAHCRAFADGRTRELPVPKRRVPPIDVEVHVALVRDGDRILVAQRPPGGRMEGLWELPAIEPSGAGLLHAAEWPGDGALIAGDELGSVAHSITCHRIRARIFAARWTETDALQPLRFARAEEMGELGLTGLARKVLRASFARQNDPRLRGESPERFGFSVLSGGSEKPRV